MVRNPRGSNTTYARTAWRATPVVAFCLPWLGELPLQVCVVCVGNKGHAVVPSAPLSGIKGPAPGRLWDPGVVKGLAPPSRAGPGPGATRARGPSSVELSKLGK